MEVTIFDKQRHPKYNAVIGCLFNTYFLLCSACLYADDGCTALNISHILGLLKIFHIVWMEIEYGPFYYNWTFYGKRILMKTI